MQAGGLNRTFVLVSPKSNVSNWNEPGQHVEEELGRF